MPGPMVCVCLCVCVCDQHQAFTIPHAHTTVHNTIRSDSQPASQGVSPCHLGSRDWSCKATEGAVHSWDDEMEIQILIMKLNPCIHYVHVHVSRVVLIRGSKQISLMGNRGFVS